MDMNITWDLGPHQDLTMYRHRKTMIMSGVIAN